jgi:hypothetical protein
MKIFGIALIILGALDLLAIPQFGMAAIDIMIAAWFCGAILIGLGSIIDELRAIRTALKPTPPPTPTSAPDGKPPATAISAEEAEWRAGKAQFEAEKTERTPRR